jgi:TolB protein
VPKQLEWIVQKALRKDRDERYQTVKELLSDLRAVKHQRSSQIWTMLAGGDVRAAKQITSGAGQDGFTGLSWTPDGRIVFGSKDGGQDDIWIMNADGSNGQRITSDDYWDQSPTVSPDGRYIIFESYRRKLNRPYLWRMDLDGANLKELTAVEDHDPNVSPDNRQVVYASWQKSQGSSMWQVSIDGGAPVQLTDYYIQVRAFSPDGNWIAFCLLRRSSDPEALAQWHHPGYRSRQARQGLRPS